MTPVKDMEHQNVQEKVHENSLSTFFLKMRQFEKKNTPTFENDFKWPTFRATAKTSVLKPSIYLI